MLKTCSAASAPRHARTGRSRLREEQLDQVLRRSTVDVADEAEIDRIGPRAASTPGAGAARRRSRRRWRRAGRSGRAPARVERGAQVDVELAGDDHLHHVERGLVGHASAGDLHGSLSRAPLELASPAGRRRGRRRRALARHAGSRDPRRPSASSGLATTSPPSLMTKRSGPRRFGHEAAQGAPVWRLDGASSSGEKPLTESPESAIEVSSRPRRMFID